MNKPAGQDKWVRIDGHVSMSSIRSLGGGVSSQHQQDQAVLQPVGVDQGDSGGAVSSRYQQDQTVLEPVGIDQGNWGAALCCSENPH